MNTIVIRGQAAQVKWGYHEAASLSAWTVTPDQIGGGTLTATVIQMDALRVAQQPLTFVVPRPGKPWRWSVNSLQVTGTSLAGSSLALLGFSPSEALAEVRFPAGPLTLVGVAGTVTSLAAMAQNLSTYDPARVHGYELSRDELRRQIDRLAAAKQHEREQMPGLDPKRADVILAGALILDGVAERAGATHVRASDRGIRWRLLYELLAVGG